MRNTYRCSTASMAAPRRLNVTLRRLSLSLSLSFFFKKESPDIILECCRWNFSPHLEHIVWYICNWYDVCWISSRSSFHTFMPLSPFSTLLFSSLNACLCYCYTFVPLPPLSSGCLRKASAALCIALFERNSRVPKEIYVHSSNLLLVKKIKNSTIKTKYVMKC